MVVFRHVRVATGYPTLRRETAILCQWKRAEAGRRSIAVEWERLARATAHPLRVSIIEILGIDGGRTLSPNELSQELQIPLSNTNYHVTELAKAG